MLFPFLNLGKSSGITRFLAFFDATPLVAWVAFTSLLFLALLGGVSAYTGGSSMRLGAGRVTLWGALAMVMTAIVGTLFESPA